MGMDTFVPLIVIAATAAVLVLSYNWARKAERKMDKEYFVVKQMALLPIFCFVFIGLGVFSYLIVLTENISKGASLTELNSNDAFGLMMGTIVIVIGGFLAFIALRWRMVVSEGAMIYTPLLGKTRTILLEDIKHIRPTITEPGFTAYDKNGQKAFRISGTCHGYMPLADAVSPYIDNAWEIPRSRGFFFRQGSAGAGENGNQSGDMGTKALQKRRIVAYIAIFVICVSAGVVLGHAIHPPGSAPKEKVFSKAGMTITLTDEFYEKDHVAYTAYYESKTAVVFAVKEEFSLFVELGMPTDIPLREYAEIVIENNSVPDLQIEEKDGLICFEYSSEASGKEFSYFAVVFRGSDAFWLVQFACESKNYETFSDDFVVLAKSIMVGNGDAV